jgi:hypothetical protein
VPPSAPNARPHVDRLEQPARIQPRQLARVAAIGLDPIPRPLRHQPRRHHLAGDSPPDQIAIQVETGRSRLITTTHRGPAAQEALDRLQVVRKRALVEQLIAADSGESDRTRVHVQPNRYRRRLVHGRRPPYLALPGTPRQPTTMRGRRPTRQPKRTPRPAGLRLHPVLLWISLIRSSSRRKRIPLARASS